MTRAANRWDITVENGQRMRTQFLIAAWASCPRARPTHFEGIDSFKGESYHTSRWPKEISRFYRQARRHYRHGRDGGPDDPDYRQGGRAPDGFPAHTNYCAPLRNGLVAETQRRFKETYDRDP